MGILLAGLASLCFVNLDVLRKVLGERLSAAQIVIGISLGSAFVFGVLVSLQGVPKWDSVFLIVASIEVVTFSIASILYVRAVTLSPLSLTIPYLAFTPVVTTITAVLILGEIPPLRGLLGIMLIVAGALLLHLENGKRLRELISAPFREPGSWRMLLVAVIWGLTTSLDKIAISHGSEVFLGFFLTLGSAFFLSVLLVIGFDLQPGFRSSRSSYREPLLYLAAAVAAVAVLAQFYAYRELLVAYVEAIKRAGGLLSVSIGAFFFGETGLRSRLPAAAIMVFGLILILF